MRRGSSTVVALVGEPNQALLPALGRSLNVVPVPAERRGVEGAIGALRAAEGVSAPFVVVGADPLGDLAREWRAMWTPGEPHAFEDAAGIVLTAWRERRFELPDYYLVVAPRAGSSAEPHRDDLHLGLLKSKRPARVVTIAANEELTEEVARALSALSALPQSPWWPPLDELVGAARSFFPAALTAEDSPAGRPPTWR